jgi:(p)ppGpp synthase/HD superfamily hydrolase
MTPAQSPRIDAALAMAARAHREQVRKGSDVPYIVHPVSVAWILARHGFDEDLQIAALLHDTVEDTELELDTIHAAFGDELARLVSAVTEKKVEMGVKRPWRVRKAEALDHLISGADGRIAALKAADLLHNLYSTIRDLKHSGKSVWQRFNASPADWIDHTRELGARLSELLGDQPLAHDLEAAVAELIAAASA